MLSLTLELGVARRVEKVPVSLVDFCDKTTDNELVHQARTIQIEECPKMIRDSITKEVMNSLAKCLPAGLSGKTARLGVLVATMGGLG